MKRIQSVLTIFFALFVALAAFSFRAEAAGAVFDNAKVLSTAEVQKLNEEIQRIEKKHNVRIGIVVQPSMQGRPIGQVANALLDQGFRGAPNGGIVLLVSVDPKKREYYMSTDNAMRAKKLAQRKAQRIDYDKFKGLVILAVLVTRVIAVDFFQSLANHQVVFAVLVKEDVTAIEGSLSEVIDQLLLLE